MSVFVGQQTPAKQQQRKWLREASMRRLSQLVKDKTEVIGSAQKLKLSLTSIEGLETSGLSGVMIKHLQNWVDGKFQHPCYVNSLESSPHLFFSYCRCSIRKTVYVGNLRCLSD